MKILPIVALAVPAVPCIALSTDGIDADQQIFLKYLELLNEYVDSHQTLSESDAEGVFSHAWKFGHEALRTRQKHATKLATVLPGAQARRDAQLQALTEHLPPARDHGAGSARPLNYRRRSPSCNGR